MIVLGPVTLDKDMDWQDEFEWSPTTGVSARSLEGNLLTEVRALSGGRPITLVGDNNHGWQTRATVLALLDLVEAGDVSYTLTMHVGEPEERSFTVKFRHDEGNPVAFNKLYRIDIPKDDTWYTGTIMLREV